MTNLEIPSMDVSTAWGGRMLPPIYHSEGLFENTAINAISSVITTT